MKTMKYIMITMLMLISTIGFSQLMFVDNAQIESNFQWFPFNFEQTDSIGIIEQNGRNGGTFQLLLVYPDTMFQFVNITYDDATGAATADKQKERDATYLYRQIDSRLQEIYDRHARDSLYIERYINTLNYLGSYIDSTQIEIPSDTTGN